MKDKYKKEVFLNIGFPYGHYTSQYSLEEYEKLLNDHLDYLKRSAKEFEDYYKNIDNIKVSVYIGSFNGNVETDCNLMGYVPMNEKERLEVDKQLVNKAKTTEEYEKRQLKFLLNKYPNYNKNI